MAHGEQRRIEEERLRELKTFCWTQQGTVTACGSPRGLSSRAGRDDLARGWRQLRLSWEVEETPLQIQEPRGRPAMEGTRWGELMDLARDQALTCTKTQGWAFMSDEGRMRWAEALTEAAFPQHVHWTLELHG